MNVSNAKTHFVGVHRKLMAHLQQVEKKKGFVDSNSVTGSVASVSHSTMEGQLQMMPKEEIINMGEYLLFRYMNQCNIAARNGANEMLAKYTDHILMYSDFYKKKKDKVILSKPRYRIQRERSFVSFINVVRNLVKSTREYYLNKLGQRTPFINLAHDGWDSKDLDMLGVSIQFTHPVTFDHIRVAVGLRKTVDKTSISTACQVKEMIQR